MECYLFGGVQYLWLYEKDSHSEISSRPKIENWLEW